MTNYTPVSRVRCPGQRCLPVLLFSLATSLSMSSGTFAGSVVVPSNTDAGGAGIAQPFAVSDQTVDLLTGLIGIERDMMLGQLFLQDGLTSTEGSHFTHPRRDNFPLIKDGLANAGVADLEPLLIALEGASGREAVNAAYIDVLSAVQQAKVMLQPTGQDFLAAVKNTAAEAGEMLDPSGTTDVVSFQECWGLLMVARNQLDELIMTGDPASKKAAQGVALAFDDVVLSLPDPNAKAPVAFDPAIVQGLVSALEQAATAI